MFYAKVYHTSPVFFIIIYFYILLNIHRNTWHCPLQQCFSMDQTFKQPRLRETQGPFLPIFLYISSVFLQDYKKYIPLYTKKNCTGPWWSCFSNEKCHTETIHHMLNYFQNRKVIFTRRSFKFSLYAYMKPEPLPLVPRFINRSI